jgi:16S rRNA C967 or C1407 C5-methylase (RsmB/RsmF family)/NOL1/NOP2/fmu family ribosome biogenesis protein
MILPEFFLERTRAVLGKEAEALFAALEESSPVSIRRNPFKNAGFTEAPAVPWSTHGIYLEERPAFTFDPLFHAGCYYVQEASSMFVEQAFKQALALFEDATSLKVLDLCAAPGGKSTLLASLLTKDSLLVANDLIRTRANILAENLIKWGAPNVVVTQSDATAFSAFSAFFDVILTDVPCSGEGMFRKDPASVGEWSPENVKQCANRQRDIVRTIWNSLKPGGFLIYSTCTYNLTENEENVQWICENLGGNLTNIPVDDAWGVSGAQGVFSQEAFPVYRFFPHRIQGEGFFLALIRKEQDETVSSTFRKTFHKKDTFGKKQPLIPSTVKEYIRNFNDFKFYIDRQNRIAAFLDAQYDSLKLLEESLRIVHAGIILGEIKGKNMLPDISLALSNSLNTDSVQVVSLNQRQAIDYLRREAVFLAENCPLGWVLVQYQNHPLGWMKNIGNRANNSYPNEWRIRSENPF